MINSFSGDYRFLSNFYPVKIEFEELIYPSVENAYQAAKSDDIKIRKAFLTVTPGTAKRYGKTIIIRPNWESIKLQVMKELVEKKFNNPVLKALLLITKNEQLIERNNWNDCYWGVCNGIGKNHLGKILMAVRRQIQWKE